MDLYYAVIDTTVIGMTWARNAEVALDQLELSLAEEGIYDTSDIDIRRFPRNESTVLLNLEDQ